MFEFQLLMILHDDAEGRKAPADDSAPSYRIQPPAELAALPRWACWRSRTKKCRDRYKDGERTGERVVFDALHPTTGRPLAASRPDQWVTYEQVARPTGRKPFGGVGLLVRAQDGLAVVRHATPEVVAALGATAVHVEQEMDGDGLTVIVRVGVVGAKTDQFVPLSGRKACLSTVQACEGGCLDGIDALSGRNQGDDPPSGRKACQGSGPCLDGRRAFFSSSLQRHYHDEEGESVQTAVERYAKGVCEQGKAGDRGGWVYGLISVLKRHGLTPETLTPPLLLNLATAFGLDVGEVYRVVLASWPAWKAHKVPLADAVQAVRADPSLLTGLPLGDREMLLTAAVCRWMGADGEPFPLSGRVLAEVLGLSGQQAGSDVILSLVNARLIRKVKEGSYSMKKAAEYVWVAAEKSSEPTPSAVSHPSRSSSRPGWSANQTEKFNMPNKRGGFLTPEHYLAEWMLTRKLGREGRDLPEEFWTRPGLGQDYARQVVAASSLLESFRISAICKALRSKQGDGVFSLAAPFVRPLVQAEQIRLDRQGAVRHRATEDPAREPGPDSAAPSFGPRPTLVSKPSLLQKLKGF